MFSRYAHFFREARRSYTPAKEAEERSGDFPAWLLYRRVSYVVTPLFLLAGFTADAVTVLAALLGVAMVPVALWGGPQAWIAVVALNLSIHVLDCVDGTIARVTRRSSPVGGMLDGLTTLLIWALYFTTVGVLAHDPAGSWVARHGRELGLALAALLLAQREMEDTYDNAFRERVRWEPPVPAALPAFDLKSWGKIIEHLVAFGGLTVAALTRHLDFFLAVLVLYQLTVFALWLPRYAASIYRRSQETKPRD